MTHEWDHQVYLSDETVINGAQHAALVRGEEITVSGRIIRYTPNEAMRERMVAELAKNLFTEI